jgi:hypothetical protein
MRLSNTTIYVDAKAPTIQEAQEQAANKVLEWTSQDYPVYIHPNEDTQIQAWRLQQCDVHEDPLPGGGVEISTTFEYKFGDPHAV